MSDRCFAVSCSKRFVIIGDSHSGQAFGKSLQSFLEEGNGGPGCVARFAASSVQMHNYVGDSTKNNDNGVKLCYKSDFKVVWNDFPDGPLKQDEDKTQVPCLPTIVESESKAAEKAGENLSVAFAIGANDVGWSEERLRADIIKMKTKLKPGQECVFITPPDIPKLRSGKYLEKFVEVLKSANQGRCRIFETGSVKELRFPTKEEVLKDTRRWQWNSYDGLHYFSAKDQNLDRNDHCLGCYWAYLAARCLQGIATKGCESPVNKSQDSVNAKSSVPVGSGGSNRSSGSP